jgi:macrolide transport system ATP-binding/permease protein
MTQFLAFQDVSFSYDNLSGELFTGLTLIFPAGWTGIVGANGSGKSSLLRLAAGELTPQQGHIHRPGRVVYCAQRTDDPPAMLQEFLSSDTLSARELRGRLAVQDDYLRRWSTLSHGERKRTQIAVALWQEPEVLAVDEPSNHIDAAARDLLIERLAEYPGIGLLVSHDRSMLDRLCHACFFVDPLMMVLRPGNYTSAYAQQQMDMERLGDLREKASRQVQHLKQEMTQRRQTASREHKIRSKRGISAKDYDAKGRIDSARVSDSKAGASLRQLEGRMKQALEKLAGMAVKIESESGIFLPHCRSRRDSLFHLEAGTIHIEGDQPQHPDTLRTLEFPELLMSPTDRIALTGPNGAGKTTLIRHIVGHINLPPEKVLYIPQEIPIGQASEILEQARQLEHEQLGWVMNIISRLGSSPQRVLQTELPSPGEIRKLLLALGIAREAHLIILDEPTNHLDLPSIQCLEEALAPCPCGLLMVSHDLVFLRKLTQIRWDIQPNPQSHHRWQVRTNTNWAT